MSPTVPIPVDCKNICFECVYEVLKFFTGGLYLNFEKKKPFTSQYFLRKSVSVIRII